MEPRIVDKGSSPALGSLMKHWYCFFVGLFFPLVTHQGTVGKAWHGGLFQEAGIVC